MAAPFEAWNGFSWGKETKKRCTATKFKSLHLDLYKIIGCRKDRPLVPFLVVNFTCQLEKLIIYSQKP